MVSLTGRRVPFARSTTGRLLTATALFAALFEGAIRLVPGFFFGTGQLLWLAFPVALLLVAVAAVLDGTLPPWTALLAVPISALYLYTGLVLPWNQLSYAVATTVLDGLLSVPLVGGLHAELLFGGHTLSFETIRNSWLIRAAIVAGVAGGTVLAFYRSHRRSRSVEASGARN